MQKKILALVVGLAVVIFGGLMLFVSAKQGSTGSFTSVTVAQTAKAAPESPVAVQQPPSAKTVAAQLNCLHFTDLGSGDHGAVLDSGSCRIGQVKYAINTFASASSRDAWLKEAEPYGVVPEWKTTTSVVYKSVD